ncbi:MAG: hypothetical protein ACRDRR_03045 [Pseudonocardiaceae bacterium]
MDTKQFTPVVRHVDGEGSVEFVVATLNEIDHDQDVTLSGFFGRQDVAL